METVKKALVLVAYGILIGLGFVIAGIIGKKLFGEPGKPGMVHGLRQKMMVSRGIASARKQARRVQKSMRQGQVRLGNVDVPVENAG